MYRFDKVVSVFKEGYIYFLNNLLTVKKNSVSILCTATLDTHIREGVRY